MKAPLWSVIGLILVIALAVSQVPDSAQTQPAAVVAPAPVRDRTDVAAALESAPMLLVENIGQFDAHARFQVRGAGWTLWLAEDGLWVTLTPNPSPAAAGEGNIAATPPLPKLGERGTGGEGVNLKLSFVGANPHPRLKPLNRLATHVSYFIGHDPAKWYVDVPVWGGVRYVDLYPGIDLELNQDLRGLGDLGGLRLIVHPGADLSAVRLRVEGAEELALEGARLRLTTAIGPVSLPPLLTGDGIPLAPTLIGDELTFAPHPFNPFPEAVDRPSAGPTGLLYSTYLGGSGNDCDANNKCAIAVDANGAAYITGYTSSTDFPTTPGAFQTTLSGSRDAFVTKLSADGSGLVYSTLLGGSEIEDGYGMAVNASGVAYITGQTNSPDFPTTLSAFQTTCGGCPTYFDIFVTKLNATGTGLLYSTFLGGSGPDGWPDGGIAVDADGAAYVTGSTASSDFPIMPGAFQTTLGGYDDAFVTKLNPSGSGLIYSTFLGGSYIDRGFSIIVDASPMAYVTGVTDSDDFPTTPGAFQTTGGNDSFVTKLNATGSALVYSTFLGGDDTDSGYGIAVDGSGAAYITGNTRSSNFPTTAGAFQTACGGCPFRTDGFVTKLNAAGSGLTYSTFLGGSIYDYGYGIAVDASGAAYITGMTESSDFPTTPGAFQTTFGGSGDGFMTKFNPAGSGLVYSTFLGGGYGDGGSGLVVDAIGAVYATGYTWSLNFPVTSGAYQITLGGLSDAFVTKLWLESGPTPTPTDTPTVTPTPTPTVTPTSAPYWLYLPLILNGR